MKRTIAYFLIYALLVGTASARFAMWPGLDLSYIDINADEGMGAMSVYWTGEQPLDAYEGRWLKFEYFEGAEPLTLELWITHWVGVCKPPCELDAYFILQELRGM